MTATCKAWAIKMPFGKIPYLFAYSIKRTRRETINDFTYNAHSTWEKLYRNGYRCVKVLVQEQ